MRTGITTLPLHGGKAPRWLFSRMTELAREISTIIIEEYGPEQMLVRLSNPYWFQAFGCVLGFDWHSSGLTTTVCGALKEGLKDRQRSLEFFVCGGKAATSRKTPFELQTLGDRGYIEKDPVKLIYASKMSAKVDSSAVQDGYQLYHHNFFVTKCGKWAVVQQGMKTEQKGYPNYARRYHWLSDDVKSFTKDPQSAICCDLRNSQTLNLVSSKSQQAQMTITQLSKESPDSVKKEFESIVTQHKNLPPTEPNLALFDSKDSTIAKVPVNKPKTYNLPAHHEVRLSQIKPQNLEKILLTTYDNPPKNFEDLLSRRGIGAKTLRALTLISEIVHGKKADWEDPAKYSFAHGGKDGHPYPVDLKTYQESIEFLRKAIRRCRISTSEKQKSQLRLEQFYKGHN